MVEILGNYTIGGELMHLIELNKLKEVNISFEQVSELSVPNYKVIETNIVATVITKSETKAFTIEFMLPANACYYALLGAKFIPIADQKTLRLEVRYSESKTENYENTLAYSGKTVFKGLSAEYVETVLSTAVEYFHCNKTPAGIIVFDTAAYCDVGSSPLMFKIATKTVLEILLNNNYPSKNDEIKEICEKNLLERK